MAESAVVGFPHEIKGEGKGFRGGNSYSSEKYYVDNINTHKLLKESKAEKRVRGTAQRVKEEPLPMET